MICTGEKLELLELTPTKVHALWYSVNDLMSISYYKDKLEWREREENIEIGKRKYRRHRTATFSSLSNVLWYRSWSSVKIGRWMVGICVLPRVDRKQRKYIELEMRHWFYVWLWIVRETGKRKNEQNFTFLLFIRKLLMTILNTTDKVDFLTTMRHFG